MTDLEIRVSYIEDAIVAIASLRDPAQRAYPVPGRDQRARDMNAAEHRLAELAAEIRSEQQN